MTHDAVVLNAGEVACVVAVMGSTVMEQKHRVLAATVQPTHLHTLFAPLHEDVKLTIARLKKRTGDLILAVRRKRGDDRRRLWTQGQHPVFIFDDEHLHNVIAYIRGHNIRAGRPADPYDWIAPLYPPRNHLGPEKI